MAVEHKLTCPLSCGPSESTKNPFSFLIRAPTSSSVTFVIFSRLNWYADHNYSFEVRDFTRNIRLLIDNSTRYNLKIYQNSKVSKLKYNVGSFGLLGKNSNTIINFIDQHTEKQFTSSPVDRNRETLRGELLPCITFTFSTSYIRFTMLICAGITFI